MAFELKGIIDNQYENELEFKKQLKERGISAINEYMKQYYKIRNIIDKMANKYMTDDLFFLQKEIRIFSQKGMLAIAFPRGEDNVD